MAEDRRLWVFAYDIGDDVRRRRMAALLQRRAVRVQYSVFEARLSEKAARALARRARRWLGPGDSLRVYAVPEAALEECLAFGGAPLPADGDYLLF